MERSRVLRKGLKLGSRRVFLPAAILYCASIAEQTDSSLFALCVALAIATDP